MFKNLPVKYCLFGLLFFSFFSLNAQENIPVTNSVIVEGDIKASHTFTLGEIRSFEPRTQDSLVIYNHRMEVRKVMKGIKIVLLKDLLRNTEFNAESAKLLSEFCIVCVASDKYSVVFSWNEIFNTDVGDKVGIIVEADQLPADKSDDHIALLSPADHATGRRFVKGLQKIIIKRVSSN